MVLFCYILPASALLAVLVSGSEPESASQSVGRRIRLQGRQRQVLREQAKREGAELLGKRAIPFFRSYSSESQRPRSIELFGKRSGNGRRTFFRGARQAATLRGRQGRAEYGFAVTGRADDQLVTPWKRVEEREFRGLLVKQFINFAIIRPFVNLV